MERLIKEAKIKELLTGQKQFGTITITDTKVDAEGREHPIILSQCEFYNPQRIENIEVKIIYNKS